MSQQHAEEQVTHHEEVPQHPVEVITAEETTSDQNRVIPFNEEITRAKSHLNAIIEQMAEDTRQLQQRLDLREPQTAAQLSHINSLITQVEAKLQQLAQQQQTLQSRSDALADGQSQLEGKQQILQTTQQQLEAKHQQLTSEVAEEIRTIADTLKKLDQRITVLEPTPGKLQLLSEKLEKVEARLTEAGEKLTGRVDELERRGHLFDIYLKDLKRRNHRLEEKSQDLDYARKTMAATIERRSVIFGAIAAIFFITLISLGYLLNGQQHLNQQQSSTINAVGEQVAALDTAINPQFDVASSAITIPVYGSDWVLAQKPELFTIELFGSHTKAEVFNYIRQHQHLLIDPVSYIQTKYRGRDWYVVFYGNYQNAAEAQAIMGVLPPLLRKGNTQIHNLGWVQQRS